MRLKIALRHISILFGLWSLSILAIVSCGSSEEVNSYPPTIELGSPTVEAVGGSQFLYVKSDITWKLSVVSEYGGEVEWVTFDQTSGDGDCNVVMKVSPNNSDEGRVATIIVTSKAGEDSVVLTQKGQVSSSSRGNLSPKTGWMELPAIPDGADAFTHSMTIGSVKTRNYSFIWDYDNLVAPWVAYPLSRWNVGTGSRSDAWGLDPLLDEDKQPVLHFRGYSVGNSGRYDRGHQLPSADRPNIKGADPQKNPNAMTFYGTNMTPQLNGFNGGIWANLEGKVRSWANESDTLYVVTGCVIDYKDGETVKYALDNNGKKVTVPTGYYKVVLRYRANSTFGYSGYSACAILFDHKVYSDKRITSEYSMSVDDLEKKTGIDFFVNLPAKVGEETTARIEAEDPKDVTWWWR